MCERGGAMFSELLALGVALSLLKGVTLLVSYINNNAFPQPLKEEDEAHYLGILSQSKQRAPSNPKDIRNNLG